MIRLSHGQINPDHDRRNNKQKQSKTNPTMSAHRLHITVKAVSLAKDISKLQSELNRLRSVQIKFNQEIPVSLHRRRGWLNPEERARIVTYFNAGISSAEIAEKFSCSVPTVYSCFRRDLWKNAFSWEKAYNNSVG
jgi:hypothetical protein